MKNIRVFLSENYQFLEMKFSVYLNRCVFVMQQGDHNGSTNHNIWTAKRTKHGKKSGSALRKHAYSNILKISPPKNERSQINILIFFLFLLKTYIVVLVRAASPRWF